MEALILAFLLSSPDYSVRESVDLSKASTESVVFLSCHSDLEVRSRAVREIDRRSDWFASRLGHPANLPWISALPVAWPNRGQVASDWTWKARAKECDWEIQGEWKQERVATKLYLESLPRAEAEALLIRMPMGMHWQGSYAVHEWNADGACDTKTVDGCWIMLVPGEFDFWGEVRTESVRVPKECWPK